MTDRGSAAGMRRTALIDVAAFMRNIEDFIARHGECIVDARANAYGHSVVPLARAALDAGASALRITAAQEPELAFLKRSLLMVLPSRRPTAGAEAYGLTPGSIPVMTLIGEVIAVKPTEVGAGVSYGYSYRTSAETTLALVGLGYADGVPRLASNHAQVFIGGALHPLVGRVAMDQFVVDMGSSAAAVAVGDEAVLFGDATAGHPLASDWAAATERSALDLVAGLGSRIERILR